VDHAPTIQGAGTGGQAVATGIMSEPLFRARIGGLSLLSVCVLAFSISPLMVGALFALVCALAALELSTLDLSPLRESSDSVPVRRGTEIGPSRWVRSISTRVTEQGADTIERCGPI